MKGGLDIVIPWSHGLGPERREALVAVTGTLDRLDPASVMLVEASPGGIPDQGIPSSLRHEVLDMEWNKSRLVNLAVRDLCASAWIMMLDGDLLLGERLPESLARLKESQGAVMPFGKAVRLDQEDTRRLLAGLPVYQGVKRRFAAVMGGGAMIIRRDLYLRLRGYDERLPYMEDTDFGHRISVAGRTRVLRHGEDAYHLWHPPSAYPKEVCRAIFERRKRMNPERLVADTVSCIGPNA